MIDQRMAEADQSVATCGQLLSSSDLTSTSNQFKDSGSQGQKMKWILRHVRFHLVQDGWLELSQAISHSRV